MPRTANTAGPAPQAQSGETMEGKFPIHLRRIGWYPKRCPEVKGKGTAREKNDGDDVRVHPRSGDRNHTRASADHDRATRTRLGRTGQVGARLRLRPQRGGRPSSRTLAPAHLRRHRRTRRPGGVLPRSGRNSGTGHHPRGTSKACDAALEMGGAGGRARERNRDHEHAGRA